MPIAWSIRSYLLALVLAVALPLAGLLAYALQENYRQALQDTQGAAIRMSEVVAADNQRFVTDAKELLAVLAARPLVRVLDAKRCDPLLGEFKALFPRYANLAIANRDGEVICSALTKPAGKRPSVAAMAWFSQIKRENHFLAGNAHVGPVSGKWVIVLAQPIKDNDGAFAGLIGYSVDLSSYRPIPDNMSTPPGMTVSLVDAAGAVISRSDHNTDSIGQPFADREALLLAMRQEPGAAMIGAEGSSRLVAYSRVAGTDWRVIGIQPAEAVLRNLWLRDNEKYLLALFLILLGSGAAFYVGRRIVHPIDHIASTALRIAQGLFETRARVEGPQEIAGVALRFNQMLDVRLKVEAKYRNLLESALDAVLVVNAEGLLILVNAQAEHEFGYSREEMLGQPIEMLVGEHQRPKHQQQVADHLAAPVARRHARVVEGRRKDGSMFPCDVTLNPLQTEDGLIVSAFVRDLTERTQYQEQLLYLAEYDPLTGLPNRTLLRDRLAHAMARVDRLGGRVAVFYLDLDRFKEINDFHGHEFADRLLKHCAERMRAVLREGDTLARFGSDEFIAILEQEEGESESLVQVVASRIHSSLSQALRLDNKEIHPSVSFGIAVYPNDGADVDTLLKSADLALTQARREGGNTFSFFEMEMDARAAERQSLLSRLRGALDRNEFMVYYQPQVDTADGRMVGVEALLRWQNPDLGMVAPDRFIPLAEEAGLIEAIGEWVLRTACVQAVEWRRQGVSLMTMAVNLSPRQFRQEQLALVVRQALRESGLDAWCLELEITESMLVDSPEQAISTLHELHSMGVRIALDDFGTGYSSLSYLKRFPVSLLKIDKSFVRDIPQDHDDAAIVAAIVSLAHNLRMGVIAEGVETDAQHHFLVDLGCELCQGYLFSRPVPASEIPALFAAH